MSCYVLFAKTPLVIITLFLLFFGVTQSGRLRYDIDAGPWESQQILRQITSTLRAGNVLVTTDDRMSAFQKRFPDLYKLDGYLTFYAYGFAVRKDFRFADNMTQLFVKYGGSGYFHEVVVVVTGLLLLLSLLLFLLSLSLWLLLLSLLLSKNAIRSGHQ